MDNADETAAAVFDFHVVFVVEAVDEGAQLGGGVFA